MQRIVISIFFIILTTISAGASEWPTISTEAREAILIDYETGAVLLEKNADASMPPASMSKLMTVALVFERLKEGSLTMEDTLRVSERAWRKGGSKMFVEVGKRVSIEDLLRGIIIQSGNDACIVVAEGLAGSEEAFAEQMTARARELGMTQSTFANATGWPDPKHRMTARELAALARYIIQEFPDYYSLFSEQEFVFSDIRQGNRNPLLYRNIGADGLKTGHTKEAGYGLTASAIRGDRRLILVVNGLPSMKARADEAERLLDWGFRSFENYPIATAGKTIAEIPIWQGTSPTVSVVADQDITLTLPRAKGKGISASVVYESPMRAPITAGAPIARLRVARSGEAVEEMALMATEDVERLGPIGRIQSVVNLLLLGAQ